mmetsp:Transcript_2181/g.6353  ORF Transcript_2181/g.6353 Transcript_2181/m.6353 type:complete len:254 (+) Transcript_2181:272-1033(+)
MENGHDVLVPLQHMLHVVLIKRRYFTFPSQHVCNSVQQIQGSRRQNCCDAWLVERPQYQLVQLVGIIFWLVPTSGMCFGCPNGELEHFLSLKFWNVFECVGYLNWVAGDVGKPPSCPGFEGNHTNAILYCCLEHLLANSSVMICNEIYGKHHGVNQACFNHSNCHGLRVRREPNGVDHAVLFGFLERFHCTTLGQDLFDILLGANRMKLVEIQMVRLQCRQCIGQVLRRSFGAPKHCFGRQEHSLPIRPQGRS